MLALLAAVTICSPYQSPVMTPFEAKIGFKPLFDGKTTTGWKAWKSDGVPTRWKAENGELVLKSGEGSGGDLCTVLQFGDFDFRLEFKIAPRGNSGIIYRAGEDYPESWKTGPEFQVLDDYAATQGKATRFSTASFYELYAAPMMLSRPAGEWNDVRIVAKGRHIEHWFNNVKVVDCVIGSEDWNARRQRSKFVAFPEFAQKSRGFIVLQDHGASVAFRRVRIREL